MNKLIISLFLVLAAICAVSCTYRAQYNSYQSYPSYGYQSYPSYGYGANYGYNYGPSYGYRGFSAGVVPAYSSYQPYYQPYYSNGYYGPSYYPYASKA